MERVSFEIERAEVYDALQAEAAAHGRSVEVEVATLVENTYGAKKRGSHVPNIQRLIELGKGLDFDPPPRQTFLVDEPEL